MAQSKAHKYFNKFNGWAKHESAVTAEETEAFEEFFVNPSRIPQERFGQVDALFRDWFLLERKLTRSGLTPLDLFMKTNQRRFDKNEAAIYQAFRENRRFGIFKIAAVEAGHWLELTPVPRGDTCRVIDEKASEGAEGGEFLIARLLPFQDHWALSTFVARMPPEGDYELERLLQKRSDTLKDEPISHRVILGMFMPKVDWEREGLPRVRARFASLLQRWGVADITVAQIEKDILASHQKAAKEHPLFRVVIGKAPSTEAVNEVMPLLQAMWNLTLDADGPAAGPKERALLADLQRIVMERLPVEEMANEDVFRPRAREITREWLAAPQKELGGRSPVEAIREERRILGNPQQEVGYEVQAALLEPQREFEAADLVNQAIDRIQGGHAQAALDLLQKAYPLIKDHKEAFRVLGNIATAYVMMGNRKQALVTLRAALKANPDYKVARDNLGLLESLSPEEFERKHRSGFFKKMNVIRER